MILFKAGSSDVQRLFDCITVLLIFVFDRNVVESMESECNALFLFNVNS